MIFQAPKTPFLDIIFLALAAVLSASGAHGQAPVPQEQAAPIVLPEVDVVASSPLLGEGVERDKVPDATTVLDADDVRLTGVPSLTRALVDELAEFS